MKQSSYIKNWLNFHALDTTHREQVSLLPSAPTAEVCDATKDSMKYFSPSPKAHNTK